MVDVVFICCTFVAKIKCHSSYATALWHRKASAVQKIRKNSTETKEGTTGHCFLSKLPEVFPDTNFLPDQTCKSCLDVS